MCDLHNLHCRMADFIYFNIFVLMVNLASASMYIKEWLNSENGGMVQNGRAAFAGSKIECGSICEVQLDCDGFQKPPSNKICKLFKINNLTLARIYLQSDMRQVYVNAKMYELDYYDDYSDGD